MFYYLSLAAALFAIGLFGVLSKRTTIGLLISIMIILNAVIINFAVFNKYVQSDGPLGQLFITFVLIISVAELLLGVAVVHLIYHSGMDVAEESINILK